MLFSEKAGRLFEHREAGEFLTAPKKAFARGQPKAKLQGRFFWYFSCRQEKYSE